MSSHFAGKIGACKGVEFFIRGELWQQPTFIGNIPPITEREPRDPADKIWFPGNFTSAFWDDLSRMKARWESHEESIREKAHYKYHNCAGRRKQRSTMWIFVNCMYIIQ